MNGRMESIHGAKGLDLNIFPTFAVPVGYLQIPNTERLNEALHKKLLSWEKDEGARSSAPTPVARHALYESDFSLFRRDDPDIRQLAHTCLSAIGQIVKEINGYSLQEMQQLRIYDHSWYHVTRYGGFFGSHNHPMASWSGVYCVTPGSELPPEKRGGILRFLEARSTASMYMDPGNAYMSSPYTFGDVTYPLEAGTLVLFPSFLLHEVTPFWGDGERITVAFNCWLRYADQAVDEPEIRLRQPSK